MSKHEDSWLKRQQRLPISDIAEDYVSVTDVKQYIYCPRIVYFDRVLNAKPIFGAQQEDSKELHEDYVAKELRRKDAVYYSPEFVGQQDPHKKSNCSPLKSASVIRCTSMLNHIWGK